MEGLLSEYINLLNSWREIFHQKRIFFRSLSLALSFCLSLGRKTISRALCAAGFDQRDWTASYRFFSKRLWSPRVLFRPVFKNVHKFLDGEDMIAVAYDDTLVRKSGKKIRNSSWQRDPLSPPFSVNFVWGLRYLQASLLVPLYKQKEPLPPRALPVQFEQLPKFKKPSRRASDEEWRKYEELISKYNTSTRFVSELRYLRRELDVQGFREKPLLASCDGSFCNRTCFTADIERTQIIARARKNARLYKRNLSEQSKGRGPKKFYNPASFTPEDVRRDESIAYSQTSIFYGGKFRPVRFKDIREVYWKWGTKRKPLRLLVIAPTPYRRDKKGKLRYRDPAYLLTTDLTTAAETLIQKYFDRWQIEVNFKEEKDLMGLGKQQVWSRRSIPRLPAFIAAIYSLLLLASLLRFNDKRDPNIFIERPKWRKKEDQGRPSCLDLLALIRKEILQTENWPPGLLEITDKLNVITKAAA